MQTTRIICQKKNNQDLQIGKVSMSTLKKKTILVTGATGFVGSNVLRRLSRSRADLHVIARESSSLWRIEDIIDDVKRYTPDLSDTGSIKKVIHEINPDIVYHLATYGGNPRQDNFRQIIESNFFGTINLLNACKETGFDLFVNTGSSSEYGIKPVPMKETDLLEPRNNYGISKIASTLYCQSVALNENLPVITVRLFSPYGDYEDRSRLIPSVILSCLRGKNPEISSPDFVRDFIYIEDVIDLYEKLPDAGTISGHIFNAGSGKQHTVGEVVNSIIRITGNMVKPVVGLPQQWPNEPEVWQADMSKTIKTLDWVPKHNLDAGLKKAVGWFENHQHLYR
jgi:nucleoside-diphosphate-sugar epimerase